MTEDITDEEQATVEAEHEAMLDQLVAVFKSLRARDRAVGHATDDGALGGVGMAVEVLSPISQQMLLPLAVRRLAGQAEIEAAALVTYADAEHPHAEGVSTTTDYGTGIEYDAVCSGCGSSWVEDEGGCTERIALLAAAAAVRHG